MFTSSMPNLFSADLDAALAFYRDLLGFAVQSRFPPDGPPVHVILRLGDSWLALSAPDAATAAGLRPQPGTPFELLVSCDDVAGETATLRAAGVRVLVAPYRHPGGHQRSYVADPDGNAVALVDVGLH